MEEFIHVQEHNLSLFWPTILFITFDSIVRELATGDNQEMINTSLNPPPRIHLRAGVNQVLADLR